MLTKDDICSTINTVLQQIKRLVMKQFKIPIREDQFKSLKDGDEITGMDGTLYEVVGDCTIERCSSTPVICLNRNHETKLYRHWFGDIVNDCWAIEQNLN